MTDFATAECGIRQLHARYVDAIWRRDFVAFGDCFAEDCVWHVDDMVAYGREGAVDFIQRMLEHFRCLLIELQTPILDVGDGTATGRTYFTAKNVLAEGSAFAPMGIYFERFVDEGGRWRFDWRMFQTNYKGPPDLSGTFFDNADFGPPPGFPEMHEPEPGRRERMAAIPPPYAKPERANPECP